MFLSNVSFLAICTVFHLSVLQFCFLNNVPLAKVEIFFEMCK